MAGGTGDSGEGVGGKETSDTPREQSEKEQENQEYVTGLKLLAVLGSVTLSGFLMLLDGTIIGTAIPNITSQFHSLPDVGWYMAAYQLASAALQPLTGKMFTYYNNKWAYLVFFTIFELGSLVCGLASSSSMLIGGRAIAGLGGSGLLNGGMTIIAGAVPLAKRPLYTGIYLGTIQVGTVCGPLVGGLLTEYASWRWCFYINLPIGAVACIFLTLVKVPELTSKKPFTLSVVRETIPELDLPGFALFAPAAIMFLLALQLGATNYAWNSSTVIGLFCGAAATAIIFLCWERHTGDRAMIPFSIVKQRIVWCSALNGAALVVSLLVAGQYIPIYFQGVLGYKPAMSGVNTLPSILSQMATVILSGFLIQKVGFYLPFAAVGSAISAVGNGLVSMFSPSTKTGMWIGYQIVLGGGRGIGMQTGLIAVQNALPPQKLPVALAFLIFCQNFAGAVFIEVANVIFTQSLASEIRAHAPSVSPKAALAAGASPSAVRALVPKGSPELGGVLLAFANSVDKVFYMLIACCLGGLLCAPGMGWVDTRKNNKMPETG
ncbi:efflux pump protein [Mytilinidion resinicola]|uniref:Efflux pump protein n=1 Tax=Mytilinidion resinicola TaxID=574789 RepID=A0A6A6YTQ2_9PEZI|nr:efflux pump protein [Mytilinidion resinicola]KAF2811345.1 efflux pump protein [Mytilinidion resinicola]